MIALVNETTGRTLARNLSVALDVTSRFMGLMGRTDFSEDAALGLSQCDWVHTFLVKFPLDLVYCDKSGRAMSIISNLQPNRFAARIPGAFWAYEMRGGCLAPYVAPGDHLTALSSSTAAMAPGEA